MQTGDDRFGPFQLDSAGFHLLRDGVPVPLGRHRRVLLRALKAGLKTRLY